MSFILGNFLITSSSLILFSALSYLFSPFINMSTIMFFTSGRSSWLIFKSFLPFLIDTCYFLIFIILSFFLLRIFFSSFFFFPIKDFYIPNLMTAISEFLGFVQQWLASSFAWSSLILYLIWSVIFPQH